MERPGRLELVRHQADDRRTVEPARQTTADRHVGAQVQAHRIGQKIAELLRRRLLADIEAAWFKNAIPAPHRQQRVATAVPQIETNAFAALQLTDRRRTAFRRCGP